MIIATMDWTKTYNSSEPPVDFSKCLIEITVGVTEDSFQCCMSTFDTICSTIAKVCDLVDIYTDPFVF